MGHTVMQADYCSWFTKARPGGAGGWALSCPARGLIPLLIAILLVCGPSVTTATAEPPAAPGQGRVAADSAVLLADLGEVRDRPAAPRAKDGRPGLYSRAPVLYWALMNQDIYVYRRNIDGLSWQEVRTQRKLRRNAGQNLKRSQLNLVRLPASLDAPQLVPPELLGGIRLLLRDPDGHIHHLPPLKNSAQPIVVPIGQELNGRYILSAQLELDPAYIDLPSGAQRVTLYAKQFVTHHNRDLDHGSRPEVFFHDPAEVPFEIGPVVNNAKNKFGGGMQIPHSSYEMLVKYHNRPLAGCEVSVFAEGGKWQGRYTTDSQGIFTITPIDDRSIERRWQHYLYVAEHFDPDDSNLHIATLSVIILKNRPEWRSKSMGLWFWAVTGSALVLLLTAGAAWRRRRRDHRSLVVFENRRVKEE